jgi:hypothetical protein
MKFITYIFRQIIFNKLNKSFFLNIVNCYANLCNIEYYITALCWSIYFPFIAIDSAETIYNLQYFMLVCLEKSKLC